MRERGLKFINNLDWEKNGSSRSREGAWIEIVMEVLGNNQGLCRSREGAWIEILVAEGELSTILSSLP